MRELFLAAFVFASTAVALTARADTGPSQPWAGTEGSTPSRTAWMARLELGFRSVAPSVQQDLLTEDGYAASARFVIAGEFGRLFTPVVGLSAWTDFSIRSANPPGGGPKMNEDVFMLGAGVPLLPLGWQSSGLMFVPRFGYGWSWMSIGGRAEPVGAFAYGGDIGLVWPRIHLSIAFGWLNGPTRAPGETGRRSNFGGISFLIGGLIDG
jgi:hypothetical protein